MAKRKSIIIHDRWFDLMINKVNPEQTVEIIKLIHAKHNDYEYVCMDDAVNAHWYHMEEVVISASESYDRKVEANRRNGKKGGAPKGNKNASKTTQTTQNNPNNLNNKNRNTVPIRNRVVSSEETFNDVPSSEIINTL